MKASDAKRLKELEGQNTRLKKIVANQALDIDMLREVTGCKQLGKSDPEPQTQRRQHAA